MRVGGENVEDLRKRVEFLFNVMRDLDIRRGEGTLTEEEYKVQYNEIVDLLEILNHILECRLPRIKSKK